MNAFQTYRSRLASFVRKFGVEILGSMAVLFFCISFLTPSYSFQVGREVRRVERAMHQRQSIARHYAMKALQAPPDEWMDFPDFPEDMVIYKYNLDTLQSWVHEFPIGNDEIGVYPFTYKLQYLSNSNIFNSPLAYIDSTEQYVNLGSDWYVIDRVTSASGLTEILTGIRIKTEYPYGDVPGAVNDKLRLHKRFTTVSISEDNGAVVRGIGGNPLFSIVTSNEQALDFWGSHLRWIALLFSALSLLLLHYESRSWRSFFIATAGLMLIRLASLLLSHGASSSAELFSPLLYAENDIFPSLGEFLLNNTLISLIAYCLFIMRDYRLRRPAGVRMAGLLSALAATGVAWYTHYALKSLVLNSNLVLEPFRISEISLYSTLCYFSFAMLFLALLDMLQMAVSFLFPKSGISLFSWRNIIIYIAFVSLFCIIDEGVHGLEKEYDINKVNTGKMASERDLPLEYQLHSVEREIASDPFISMLALANGTDLIKSRLMDRYFDKDINQKYNLNLAVCSSDNLLNLGTGSVPVPCMDFFVSQLTEYGVAIDDDSDFYYINNFDDRVSYIGVFQYLAEDATDPVRLFVEIVSRFREDPFDIANIQNGGAVRGSNLMISTARYSSGRLISSSGRYNYPVIPSSNYEIGYTKTNKNGYVHFVNRVSEDEIVVISRRLRPLFPYIVSFSYFMIFFGIFLLLATRWARPTRALNLPRHSLKRRITLLTTGSMIVAIAALTAAVVSYTMKIRAEGNRGQMDAKIAAVQESLAPYCKYAMRYNALRTPQFLAAMEDVAAITRTDINIYDTEGMLICSTKPEIFSQYFIGKRMNFQAYNNIVRLNAQRYSGVEKLGNLSFDSVYAPLFNESGDMVAIVNVPYISSVADVNAATSPTVAMIINLCLVLLIAATIVGVLLSNSLISPILAIRDRMNRLTASDGEDRHVNYPNTNDELGVLIQSYNRMVDDLDESTRRLAQSEREQAWKEMARKVAHDIKNPLTPMRLSIQYLIRLKNQSVPGWEDKVEAISTSLLEQIDVLSDTASEFSAIAKSFTEDAVVLNVDELIGEQVTIFDNREDISFEYECIPSAPMVMARRPQLARVFVNLLTNAIQAIENAAGQGRVRVFVIESSISGLPAWKIQFEDSGPGVSDENLEKLFTPNFTTKSSGSGLGLSICKSVVEQAGGSIRYSRSEKLGGACFTLLLPKVNVNGAAREVEVAS